MPDDQFHELISRIKSAKSYSEIMTLTSNMLVAFDQRVHIEDLCAEIFVSLLRESNDLAFANKIRRVNRDKPKWLKLIKLSELVREELDLRFLIARLPKTSEATL